MSHFVFILKLEEHYHNPDNWNDDTTAIIQQHFNYLQQRFLNNEVLFVGRTNYQPGHPDLQGWAVLNTDNEIQALEWMNQDPCIIHGVMKATLHPFSAAMYHNPDATS